MKDKKNTHPPTTVLLDMHAILHRAFHALPDFTGPHGEPTGALYGLSTFLFKVAEDLAPDHIIATYDLPEPTHRHEAFGAYKAQREKTDSALVAQLVASRDILHAFGIPFLEAKGFEADDILGTLTHAPSLAEHHLVIASGDMDTLQLVSGDRVVVYTLKRGVNETMLYNEHAVCERYGFPPRLVPDYKGLRGDPSDNIPGVQGIGEKTATTLITSFGDLDTLYKKLKEHPEQFEKAGITKRIMGLLLEQEDEARFGKELATIRLDAPVSVPSLSRVWREGIDPHALRETFLRFGFKSLVGRVAHLVGEETRGEVQKEEVREMVDTKTEQELSLALWLLDSDTLHPKYDEVCAYTKTRDPKRAREVLLGALEKEDLMRVYRDIELPLIPVVSRMEERGILFDRAYLAELSLRYHKEADTLAQKIYTLAGETFNINSPRQLGDILFKKLDIGGGKKTKRTATGQTSTRESELVKYESEHPIVHEVLEYREVQKLLSTYIDTFPFLLDAGDRLHAQFVQAGTTTGRMSSQNPNMQNIPIKTAKGSAIRRAIIAPEGFSLVSADYSQIELRVAAFLSGDEHLIHAFQEGGDIHTAVASEMFGVPREEVDKDMRRRAKVINFGILYGMGAQALAQTAHSSLNEAKEYLASYFEHFSGVSAYIEHTRESALRTGSTRTLFGRKRSFAGLRSPLPYVRAQAERMARNAPIQGTQADIIKLAMVRIDANLRKNGLAEKVFLISQVHDELVFEVHDSVREEAITLIQNTMEQVLTSEETKGVPLKVDVRVGKNWGESTP